MRKSVHKRPWITHVIVVPKLMPFKWRKPLLKASNVSFYINSGHLAWPSHTYESLFVAILLPSLHCYPWTWKRSKSVLEVERQVRVLQKGQTGAEGPILRQFLFFTRRVQAMHEGLVWPLLLAGTIR